VNFLKRLLRWRRVGEWARVLEFSFWDWLVGRVDLVLDEQNRLVRFEQRKR